MMKTRAFRALVVLAAVALALSWDGPLRAADEPYELYGIFPLTGSAAFLGTDEVPGLRALETYTNAHGGIRGRPLHIVIQDDQSSPQVALQLATGIIAKGVPALLGPSLGATCGAVEPLLLTKGPVMYCVSNVGHPPAGSYSFVNLQDLRDLQANCFRFMKAKGVRKLALLEATDATGIDGERSAKEALQYPDLRSIQLVDVEHYAPTDISVAAQVAHIKATGADAIANVNTGTAFGTALRGIYEAGFNGYVLGAASNASKQQMQQYLPFLPDKLIFWAFGFSLSEGIPAPVQAAKARYREAMAQVGITDPTVGNTVPWDPGSIVVSALQKLGPQATAQQVRDYILQLHDYPGIMGLYDYRRGDQRGLDPKASGVMRYDKATNTFPVISKPGGVPL